MLAHTCSLFSFYLGTNTQDCGGYFNDSSGWISSPDEDGDGIYDSNADCWWIIDPGPSKEVVFYFTKPIEIGQFATACDKDYLEVRSYAKMFIWR